MSDWVYPIVASFLAKRTHAPNLTIMLELGVVDPEPIEVGVDGLSDPKDLVSRQHLTQVLQICLDRYCTKGWWM